MYLKSINAASVALLLAGCATSPGLKTFRTLDSNSDGEVTEHEFASNISTQSFQLLDANADAGISEAEWKTKEAGTSSPALFRAMDTDHNGEVSSSEFSDAPGSRKRREIQGIFHTLDRDHDGGLSWPEVSGS
jgi:Ca2+-binding EF-hand superfamily protein